MNPRAALQRIASMDPHELSFRIACETRKAATRLQHAVRPPQWRRSDAIRVLDPAAGDDVRLAIGALRREHWQEAHRLLARHFLTRASRWPLRAREREALVSRVARRSPGAAANAAAQADRLREGVFDLLGYRDLPYGSPPDWQVDLVHRRRPPRAFWASVPYLDPACGDHKIIWELNRHQHWLALGRAFWMTGNGDYRATFVRELESWLAANPPLDGVNWASMLELAFRAISWTWSIEFFSHESQHDQSPWLVDLLVALDRQLGHVAHNLSQYFSPNTHLSGEALALYAVSQALPELRASAARAAQGRNVLIAEASRQIRTDGGHVELSPHYHRYSTDFYLLALLVARGSGDPEAPVFERAARAQAEYLRTIADDHGQMPLIGDDDGGQLSGWCGTRPADASVTLALAASVLDDASLAVGPAPEEVLWWIGPLQPIVDAEAPRPRPSRVLEASGYVVSRTPDGDHLTFDVGPHGFLNGGHAHSDALSVTLSVRGQPLLIDPGTATYTMDPRLRDWFRSTRMHNTVIVDQRDHTHPQGPFHWEHAPAARLLFSYTGNAVDVAEGTHDAYTHAAHVRTIVAVHRVGWIVVDRILGDVEVEAEAWWHVHPSWSSSLECALAMSGAAERHMDGESAVYSPEYGRVERAAALRFVKRARPPFAFATFVPAGAPASRRLNVVEVPLETSPPPGWVGNAFRMMGDFDLTVLVASPASRAVVPGGPGAPWGTAEVLTDARMCVVRNQVVVAMVGGATVEVRHALASAVHTHGA